MVSSPVWSFLALKNRENCQKMAKMAIFGNFSLIITGIIQIWANDISIDRSRREEHDYIV